VGITSPKVAGEHGAIGCIIYNRSQKATVIFNGDQYPTGGLAAERGSAARQRHGHRLSRRSADPRKSEPSPARKRPGDQKTPRPITKIPVLPIFVFRRPTALVGFARPDRSGSLARRSANYLFASGPRTRQSTSQKSHPIGSIPKPIYDVIATLRGSDPDHWVVRGNHHDAWVKMAPIDPIAGMGSRTGRSPACWVNCANKGWTTKRSIIYCAWDGEEPGLLRLRRVGGNPRRRP